jgi:predicted outer membrane repeat protein
VLAGAFLFLIIKEQMKMKRIYFSPMLFMTLVSLSLFATFAHAATLEVGTGKPYTTIQSAISDAVNGDTVLVYDGTYVENIIFNGNHITVKSVNGAASTIINGNASDSVVTFRSGAESKLDGFTITNGNNVYGGGIRCLSSAIITNCIIAGNTATYNGGGIYFMSCSLTVKNSILWGDTAAEDEEIGYAGGLQSSVTYSDVQGGWAGTGNINADPLFVGAGDYHLQPDSPCVGDERGGRWWLQEIKILD